MTADRGSRLLIRSVQRFLQFVVTIICAVIAYFIISRQSHLPVFALVIMCFIIGSIAAGLLTLLFRIIVDLIRRTS